MYSTSGRPTQRYGLLSSGISVSSEAKRVYEEVKQNKRHRFVFYYIKDEKVIDVEKTGPRDARYEDFLKELHQLKNACRYCVFDFPVPTNAIVASTGATTKMHVDRLLLMTWCPEGSEIKQRMLYSSSYDALKKALTGVYKYVQACDFDDLSLQAIEDSFRKGGK